MTLPYELHELIIDKLRYSFPELEACSLVCRAWLPRCRLHLFRVIRIGPQRHLLQLLDQIEHLEHLVIEKYWEFHANQFKWYPSFDVLVLEDIFDQWNSDFIAHGIPPLRLERLCLRKFSMKGTNLIQMVVLPSPCLDLHSLRYLAISATSLETALANEFSELGKELVHLTITNLDTSAPLDAMAFREGIVRCSHNFEAEYIAHNNALEPFNGILSSSLNPVLHGLINETDGSSGIYISMDFIHVDGSEMQQRYIRKAFPLSFATGSLHWRDRRSLEWWFE
ncbi:hypothetical protein BT96DRAFT_994770 [Gymnopus androsaceus JB14]|uniref:F-box domain-containing protein n=1 Tax=Gymnopus androsaceus JB14 TaxID=1447944 RepID=A0A6A4HLV1_9AGAR|nr:hypothetical protein BT96DRAFT_994770 [Gymnopus androsaceus JB14]